MTDGNANATSFTAQIWKPKHSKTVQVGYSGGYTHAGSARLDRDLQRIVPDSAGWELDRPSLPADDTSDVGGSDGSRDDFGVPDLGLWSVDS